MTRYPLFNKLNVLIIVLVLTACSSGYFGYQSHKKESDKLFLKNEIINIKTEASFEKESLKKIVSSLEEELMLLKEERDRLRTDLSYEQTLVNNLAGEVSNLKSAVGIIEKLNQTDSELLQKYSKAYFLNENYIPSKLIDINEKYSFEQQRVHYIHIGILTFLKAMLEEAVETGIDIKIISAYRSFNEQSELKSSYSVTYGSGANSFSADQGYSEHQLGTTVDFTTPDTGANFLAFDKTSAYEWLTKNAHRYGFVLSYPKDNIYYIYEPWHWRFVGRDLANKLYFENKYFYNLDQREIDKYLVSFFD